MKTLLRIAPSLIVAAILLFVGKAWGSAGAPAVVTRIDSVPPAAYRARLAELAIDRDGLRARLEGIESRPPEVIVRTDTLIAPPDTVVRYVTVNSRGRLTYELLGQREDTTALYAPELHEGVNVSDCDEGWQIQNGDVVCDPTRLGHLYVVAGVGRYDALAGLEWEPSYRSLWEFSAGRAFTYNRDAGDRWEVRIRRRVKLW